MIEAVQIHPLSLHPEVLPELCHLFEAEAEIFCENKLVGMGRIEHATHELPEFKGEDALIVCKEYLVELETLIQEYDRKFGA